MQHCIFTVFSSLREIKKHSVIMISILFMGRMPVTVLIYVLVSLQPGFIS